MVAVSSSQTPQPKRLVPVPLGVVIPAVAFATIVLKILVVAHFDPQSIAAILGAQRTGNVLAAVLVTSSHNLVWVAQLWSVPLFSEALRERDTLLVPTLALLISLLLVALLAPRAHFVLAVSYLLLYLVGGLPFMAWDFVRGKKSSSKPAAATASRSRQAAVWLAFGVAAVLISVLTSDRPWLPSERVKVEGTGELVGYVISEESGWITLLRDSDRSVLRLPADRVTHRQLCRGNQRDDRPLIATLVKLKRPQYQSCTPG